MTWRLAWRNLAHERVRLLMTLAGVAFCVALMGSQTAILIGCIRAAAELVDHAGADLWVTSKNTRAVDFPVEIDETHRYRVLAASGVASADALIVRYTFWRRPDGGNEVVTIVGFDVATGVGGPWNLVAGSVSALRLPDTVIIDRLYAERLGVRALGDVFDVGGRRARVVGFTQGILTFTQAPYVFTSRENALQYSRFQEGLTTYVLVRARGDADASAVARGLRAELSHLDTVSTRRFSVRTSYYWLVETGVGIALIVGVVLSLIVGTIIVSQTLYTTTLERLPEYATLRALGAPTGYLNAIVIQQAVMGAVLGYGAGVLIIIGLLVAARGTHLPIAAPWWLWVDLAALTLVMCVGASIVAVRRVLRVDPTSVFR